MNVYREWLSIKNAEKGVVSAQSNNSKSAKKTAKTEQPLPEKEQAKLKWFKEAFGELPKVRKRTPILTWEPGTWERVTIVEDDVKIMETNDGRKVPYLIVERNRIRHLLLMPKSLAMKIADLMVNYPTLEKLIIDVYRPLGTDEDRYYKVRVVGYESGEFDWITPEA